MQGTLVLTLLIKITETGASVFLLSLVSNALYNMVNISNKYNKKGGKWHTSKRKIMDSR